RPALGDACVLTVGSLYQLKSDAVDWTMRTDSGQSCIRGLRHNRVTIDTAKLISSPQSGEVQLKSDAVYWTMRTDSGETCIRGLRHNRVTIDTAKLISPPQSGQVKLLGSGFSYTAKSDFEGQDSFTLQVSGMSNGIRGSSDIRIIVSVGPSVSPQTSPT